MLGLWAWYTMSNPFPVPTSQNQMTKFPLLRNIKSYELRKIKIICAGFDGLRSLDIHTLQIASCRTEAHFYTSHWDGPSLSLSLLSRKSWRIQMTLKPSALLNTKDPILIPSAILMEDRTVFPSTFRNLSRMQKMSKFVYQSHHTWIKNSQCCCLWNMTFQEY